MDRREVDLDMVVTPEHHLSGGMGQLVGPCGSRGKLRKRHGQAALAHGTLGYDGNNRSALCNGVSLLWRIWGPQLCISGLTGSPKALKGRQSLARGVSPWRKGPRNPKPPIGGGSLSPLQG